VRVFRSISAFVSYKSPAGMPRQRIATALAAFPLPPSIIRVASF